jgi:hypothetical protein
MAATRQYVNMAHEPGKNYGRHYWLEVKIKEQKPGASEGRLVFLFVAKDGKNMDEKWLSSHGRAGGFHFTPPHRKLVTVTGKKASSWVLLSLAGGDKFKFKAGKEIDEHKAKNAKQEVEVWRKIFVRYGNMPGCKTADFKTLKDELAKAFVDVETEGPLAVGHQGFVSSPDATVALMDKGKAAMKYPDQSSKMVFVDRIAEKGRHAFTVADITGAQLQGSKIWNVTIPGDRYTWPEDKSWISGTIELLDDKGNVTHSFSQVGNIVSKVPGYPHPEGIAAQKLKIDVSRWHGLGKWIAWGKGKMRLKLQVEVIDKAAQGKASGSEPWVIIGTRHPYWHTPNAMLDNTVTHEIGHVLGLNVLVVPEYDQKTGARNGLTRNKKWYDNQFGGVGTHCSTGAKTYPVKVNGVTRREYRDGTCTMLHYVTGRTAFCPNCIHHLCRADLRKIGYRKVWPANWIGWP